MFKDSLTCFDLKLNLNLPSMPAMLSVGRWGLIMLLLCMCDLLAIVKLSVLLRDPNFGYSFVVSPKLPLK